MEFYLRTFLVVLLLTLSCVRARDATNKCTVRNGNCQYHVVLTGGGECHVQYQGSTNTGGFTPPSDIMRDSGVSSKQLEAIDNKITKLVEGLSIRTLRHVRQIRSSLKQILSAVNGMRIRQKKDSRFTCPEGFTTMGNWPSCYKFSTFNTTWHEAREYCSAFGSNLVALESIKEQYILDYLIKSSPIFEAVEGWWTSGNFVTRSRKWMWTTQHHLKPFTFSTWGIGEPDARASMECMLLLKTDNYKWHDRRCTERYHFICEASP